MLIIKYFFIHLSKKTKNMYNYEQHFKDMVSNCCGDSMEELQEFCYVCDTRTKNPIIDGGTHCNTCKQERDVIERYVCNCCDDICEPIEEYEYDQLRIYELFEAKHDCRA